MSETSRDFPKDKDKDRDRAYTTQQRPIVILLLLKRLDKIEQGKGDKPNGGNHLWKDWFRDGKQEIGLLAPLRELKLLLFQIDNKFL